MKKKYFENLVIIGVVYSLICILLTTTGLTQETCQGDLDENGVIDGVDLSIFSKNFGRYDCNLCKEDDEVNGIYRICNYLPWSHGNYWRFTTGDRIIMNEKRTCASGYSGTRYGTTSYEFEPIMEVNENGWIMAGCQYDEGILEETLQHQIVFIPPEVKPGDSWNVAQHTEFIITGRFIGIESTTVPAGTFYSLKFEFDVSATDGSCSFKTTLWLAKGIGPVKIHRTNASPADCLGCMFVCNPENDLIKLNTPAELIWAVINGSLVP
jgi:hypothetical protein